ncbi:ABC transporter permease [Lactococcus lactis]|uniref:ABC transporter permease n=1 Tax=Lactococcus lactis TaxID=1358 RepID=UPI00223B09A5|nr:ABC transporter permease [Lactococcus lactis]MCT1227057.1 ABC transporter permease [Lactococcus lactis]
MSAKNIFKMEFYRNFRDKSWLIVIGVMAILALIDSILIINLIGKTVSGYSYNSAGTAVLAALTIFFTLALGLGIWVFQIIYPFHLLSVDYSNKALGLMIASGVNRMTYYFIKLISTILSTLLALFTILIVPFFLILGVYARQLSEFLSMVSRSLSLSSVWMALLNSFAGALASIVVLFFVVIMTRGKFWGIFVYLGIAMGIGIVVTIFTSSINVVSTDGNNMISNTSLIGIIFSVVEIVSFGLLGLSLIRKQDL